MVHMAVEGIHSAVNPQTTGPQRRLGVGGEARGAYRPVTGVVMRRNACWCMPKGMTVQSLTSRLQISAAIWGALSM